MLGVRRGMARRGGWRSAQQAKADLQRWHASHWMGPGNMQGNVQDGMPYLLPFRVFRAHVEGKATTVYPDGTSVSETWKKEYHVENAPSMAVYASFRHRRDLAQQAAVGEWMENNAVPFRGHHAKNEIDPTKQSETQGTKWTRDTWNMKSSMAWNLALLGLRNQEKRTRLEKAKEKDPQAKVKVTLKALRRTQRIVHAPVYLFEYHFGEKHGRAGEIVPQTFQAMVCAVDGTVAAQRHLSAPKLSLVAGATVLSATGLVDLLMGSPLAVLDVGFFGAVAAAAGNVASRHFHAWKQQLDERERYRMEENAFEQTAEELSGPSKREEDTMLELEWLEWMRWMEQDKHHWREETRGAWAEALWKRQLARRLQRMYHEERIEKERRIHGERMAREARHRERFGSRPEDQGSWHWRGRRDHLGYYRILGLEEPEDVSQEDIKRAFHSAAKKWHPDMYTAEQTKEEASSQFKRIQMAYTILRDPEKKAMYDAGRALDAVG